MRCVLADRCGSPAARGPFARSAQFGVRRPSPPRVPFMPAAQRRSETAATWKPATPRRLRAIRDRLAAAFGRPTPRVHRAPIDELILTVLSQNTNDRNRDVAYARLRERFPSWRAVREASAAELEEAIRPGGLAPTKSVRIKQMLGAIGGDDLSRLADEPLD